MRTAPRACLTLGGLLLIASLALGMPTSAVADGHEDWELHVSGYPGPLQGACGARLEARGWSFPPGEVVAIGRVNGDSFPELTRVTTTENGFLLFDLVDPYPPNCVPGTPLAFSGRVVAGEGFLGDDDGPFEALSTLEMRPPSPGVLTVVTDERGSCDAIEISGRGFPPGMTVSLFFGDATPIAHDFAEIARAVPNADGEFVVTTDYFSRGICERGSEIGIYAWASPRGGTSATFPRASVIVTFGLPSPAAAGGVGLAPTGTPRRVSVAWLLGSLVLLTAGRTFTTRSRR